jgi:hypothetical protein
MGNNLIDGKNLMEGVGQAALIGAIGGALGGAGNALGQHLAKEAFKQGAGMATQSLLKFGIETGFDTVGNILGDLVSGNPITFESVMTSTLQGIGMSLAMSGAGKIKAVEATQTKFSDIGAGFGTSVGNKIKTGFGRGIDTPTTTPYVDTPNVKQPEVEVKALETEVKAPATEVKALETEVKAPATEVKAPETEVKAPATEVKAPEAEVKASATEVKAPEAEVKAPATEVKAPETEVKTPANNEPDRTNGRTTHADEPEVEPGIVAKEPTADGREIKVTKEGEVLRCNDGCQILGQSNNSNAQQTAQETAQNINNQSTVRSEATQELEYNHQLKSNKNTDIPKLKDQIQGQVDAMNKIIQEEGMAGLKERIRGYNVQVEQSGRKHVKSLAEAGTDDQGNALAWLHEPDMRVGGLPTDVTRTGDKRINSILGGQANRLRQTILAMSDDTTKIEWKLNILDPK